jgi:hypothetical protein
MEQKTHLPRELGLEETTGGQRLASLDDIEVLGINVTVLGKVEVLLGHEHTLCKYSQLIDLIAISILVCNSAIAACRTEGHRSVGEGRGYIPRKRYSWIFLRSSLGISLAHCQ